MNTRSLSFDTFQLIVGNSAPSLDFLRKSFEDRRKTIEYGDAWHRLSYSTINDRFFWMYSAYGKGSPRRSLVIDSNTGEDTENPRGSNHVEPNQQIFLLYDAETHTLYLSDKNKRTFVSRQLEEHSDDAPIIIKTVFTTIDEFIAKIDEVSKVVFTGKRDLFTQGGDVMEPLKNIFGYDEPERFKIDATYNQPTTARIKSWLKGMKSRQETAGVETLVIIGKDDGGFTNIFNTSTFAARVQVFPQVSEEGVFLPTTVQAELLKRLQA